MAEISNQELEMYAKHYDPYLDEITDNTASGTPSDPIDWIALIKFLLVCFAYGWWMLIIVYFGLLAESASLPLQVMSAPVIVASLALARLFQMAIHIEAYGFSILFFSGLLVAGMLA